MNETSISGVKEKFKKWIEKIHKLLNTNFDRAFGLDISDRSIEIAELSKLFRFSIENHGRVEIPDGIIKDGRILDEKALSEQIKVLLQNVKPRHISTNKVILSLPESQIFTHHFIVNTMLNGVGLRLLVQKELIKIIPISTTRMYWDIKTKPMADGGTSVVFIGVLKEIAESYIRVCNMIGLDVVGLGLEPLSVGRLLLTTEDIITAIVDIGTNTTNFSIIRGNDELELTVSIPFGGRNMTQAIAQGLNVDEATAEAKKVAVGSNTSEELFFLMEPVVKNIATEIARAISYFESNFKERVSSVLLVGGASITGGIKEKISEVIEKPVNSITHFNNFENLSILSSKKGDEKIPAMLYTSVIGLAMLGASNEFENINLLKQMPSVQINNIKRADLFNYGYLSKLTAVRVILNSRLMLVVAVILAVCSFLVFGYLWFDYSNVKNPQVRDYKTSNISREAINSSLSSILETLNRKAATSTQATSTPFMLPGAKTGPGSFLGIPGLRGGPTSTPIVPKK